MRYIALVFLLIAPLVAVSNVQHREAYVACGKLHSQQVCINILK
jgi:hypothetical protein